MIRTTDAELADRSVRGIIEELVDGIAPPGADVSFVETDAAGTGDDPERRPLTDGAEAETDRSDPEETE